MKVRFFSPDFSLPVMAAMLAFGCADVLHAQESAGTVVLKNNRHIDDFTVQQGTFETVIPLKRYFRLDGVTQQVMRFNTRLGNLDVQMAASEAPKNVANFLSYANSGAYNGSFFHRSEPGFIIQGGGYKFDTSSTGISTIPANAAVVNEYNIPNTRGTLAAAKLGGDPNSATSQWFFNLADNTKDLGTTNNGGFTVFGRVIGKGYAVLDQLNAVPVPKTGAASPFNELPLIGYTDGTTPQNSELVTVNSVAVIPLISNDAGQPGLIRFGIANSNPGLVSASISGNKLRLVYDTTQSGSANFVLKAKGPRGKAKLRFSVTVLGPVLN